MKSLCACLVLLVISLGMLPTVSATPTYNPGLITPDSVLWPLDLRMEQITEKLMWSDNARVNLQLKHANERISEMTLFPGNERAAEEYTKVLSRIESAKNLGYQTTTNVQTRLQEHSDILRSVSAQTPGIENSVILQLTQTRNSVQEKTSNMIIAEQLWWSKKVKTFDIISTPTIVSNLGDFDKFYSHLDEGITVVEVVRSDEVLLQSYIVVKEDGIVTIQTGTTDDYVKKYVMSVSQLQKYEEML